ncbi:nucleoid-associated protein [Halomonadaceae bacterium KBTZ08]
MAIHQLRLIRATLPGGGQPAQSTAGEAMAEPGGDYEALHRQLKKLFNSRPGKAYGRFSDDIASHPMRGWLGDYLDGRQTFEAFTNQVLDQWQDEITRADTDPERPLLIVHESLADGEVLYLFALEMDPVFTLDTSLELTPTETISRSRLNLAARVELEGWRGEQGSENYLTVLQGRGTGEIGKCFTRLVGFQQEVDVEAETQTFLEAVESFAQQQKEPEHAQTVRHRAFEFCNEQEALGEPVPLSALSSYIDDSEPERFAEHVAESQAVGPDQVLHPDRRKVKKLVRIAGKGNGLSLSFSSDLVNQAVHYDRDRDALVITQVPRSLKEQLQSFLDQGDE